MSNQSRQPKGTPVGGQFAGKSNPESEVELAQSSTNLQATKASTSARSFQDVLENEGPWSWTALAAEVGKPAAENLYNRCNGSLGQAMNAAHDERLLIPSEIAQTALWFTADAIRDHCDESVDDLSNKALAQIGQEALYSDIMYDAFDKAVQESLDRWRDAHCACGNSLEDGEGHDGKCGTCADREDAGA
ncbi:MAG: hypothetical protein ACYDEP_02830 [Acidimicrobiales bacterium]